LQVPKPFETTLDELRAVAEPSRLRLLAILARGEFSVTELTQVLSQSQPRVSRHLKLLCDAGLLEKFREQHWVYYRVPSAGPGREFVDEVVTRIDPADRTLVTDDMRVKAVLAQRSAAGDASNDPVTPGSSTELAAALAEELGDRGRGSLFYFGRSPAEVLVGLATRAERVVGMHRSRPAVQRARAVLHSRGLSHCLLQQGELRNLPHLTGEFDTVVVDRVLAAAAGPVEALREAARVLRADGELLVVEEYDALARLATGSNPLHVLRAWTADAGLACTRLRPVDVDGQHLLLGVARVAGALTQANEAAVA
jgi:DNA-binding transcriptional ArsR family regulator